jgi:uncharacterized protein (DUF2141 family)
MKQIKFLLLVITFSASTFMFSQNNKTSLKVNFSTEGKKGILYVGVYDGKKNFMKKKIKKLKLDMSGGENSIVVIDNLIIGKEYAITSFLDENANGTLDKNFFGVPTESYGFSNNVKGTFGPPSFDEVKLVILTKNNSINITVN